MRQKLDIEESFLAIFGMAGVGLALGTGRWPLPPGLSFLHLCKFAESYSFFLHTSHLRPCCFALGEHAARLFRALSSEDDVKAKSRFAVQTAWLAVTEPPARFDPPKI